MAPILCRTLFLSSFLKKPKMWLVLECSCIYSSLNPGLSNWWPTGCTRPAKGKIVNSRLLLGCHSSHCSGSCFLPLPQGQAHCAVGDAWTWGTAVGGNRERRWVGNLVVEGDLHEVYGHGDEGLDCHLPLCGLWGVQPLLAQPLATWELDSPALVYHITPPPPPLEQSHKAPMEENEKHSSHE